MSEFPVEAFRKINELAHLKEGYADVKAIVVEGDTVLTDDPAAAALLSEGYKVIDENCYGIGHSRIGRIVVFAK